MGVGTSMKLCVYGLWHLGTVTSAGCAAIGHEVVGLDDDAALIANLQQGQPPLYEPFLDESLTQGLQTNLRFTTNAADALQGVAGVWVTFDTPVDEEDRADVGTVVEKIKALFPSLPHQSFVLISSQVPVGTTAALELAYRTAYPQTDVIFAYSPENLRLGSALEVFLNPDRIIVGTRRPEDRERLLPLLAPITDRIEWMTTESAEMTKHAINSFLALSVTFINELAALCEQYGANAREVERGLKTEQRIGPKAYVRPGAAFAGGTLARDVAFLQALGEQKDLPMNLMRGLQASNEIHKGWAWRRLYEQLGYLEGRTIAILGLTYKAGTSTLRRSSAVELAQKIHAAGATVKAHDPSVSTLPEELQAVIALQTTPEDAVRGADAVVIATEWPEYRQIQPDQWVEWMAKPLILDAGYFLPNTIALDTRIHYYAVGLPRHD
jgi:UDPglucose 6-dehydrogenase